MSSRSSLLVPVHQALKNKELPVDKNKEGIYSS